MNGGSNPPTGTYAKGIRSKTEERGATERSEAQGGGALCVRHAPQDRLAAWKKLSRKFDRARKINEAALEMLKRSLKPKPRFDRPISD